jgi:hypothetical protein
MNLVFRLLDPKVAHAFYHSMIGLWVFLVRREEAHPYLADFRRSAQPEPVKVVSSCPRLHRGARHHLSVASVPMMSRSNVATTWSAQSRMKK